MGNGPGAHIKKDVNMTDYNQFQIILDVPARNPELNFADFGSALKDIIEGSEPRFSIPSRYWLNLTPWHGQQLQIGPGSSKKLSSRLTPRCVT